MRSPHQLFQIVLLYETTLKHVVNINIPKRRLRVNVPNIVTVHSVIMFWVEQRKAINRLLALHQIKMVSCPQFKRWRLVLIDVEIVSYREGINHPRSLLWSVVAIKFWYCHVGRCSCQTITIDQTAITEPILLDVVLALFAAITSAKLFVHHWPRHDLLINLLLK